jgi:hypothetical protein
MQAAVRNSYNQFCVRSLVIIYGVVGETVETVVETIVKYVETVETVFRLKKIKVLYFFTIDEVVSTVSTYFAMVSTTVSTVSTSVAVKPQPSWGVGWLVIKNACNLMFECIYVVLFVGNAIERFSHGGLRSDNAPIKT